MSLQLEEAAKQFKELLSANFDNGEVARSGGISFTLGGDDSKGDGVLNKVELGNFLSKLPVAQDMSDKEFSEFVRNVQNRFSEKDSGSKDVPIDNLTAEFEKMLHSADQDSRKGVIDARELQIAQKGFETSLAGR